MEKHAIKKSVAFLLASVMLLSTPVTALADATDGGEIVPLFLENMESFAEGVFRYVLAAEAEEVKEAEESSVPEVTFFETEAAFGTEVGEPEGQEPAFTLLGASPLKLSATSIASQSWYRGTEASPSEIESLAVRMNASPSAMERAYAWSAADDGSDEIMAWYEFNDFSNVVIGISTDSYIRAYQDPQQFLSGFSGLTSLDLSALYTGDVTSAPDFMADAVNLKYLTLGMGWTGSCAVIAPDLSRSDGYWYDSTLTKKYLASEIPAGEGSYQVRPRYTVNFDMQQHGDIQINTISAYTGELIPEPTEPTDENYVFQAWYQSSDYKNKWEFTFDRMPENDLTLYAKWMKPDMNFASASNWYKGRTSRAAIGTITFDPKFDPEKAEIVESWYADKSANGGIVCHVVNRGTEKQPDYELIIDNYYDDRKCIACPDSSKMFSGFSSLKTFRGLQWFNASSLTDTSDMFKGCASLEGFDLSTLGMENVTDISGMFYGCLNLTDLDLTKAIMSSLEKADSVFRDCEKLTASDLSKMDFSRVTDLENLFSGCDSLETITFGPNFSITNAENLSGMFRDCVSLQTVDLSRFDTKKVRDMRSMFSGCAALSSLDLSGFQTPALASASNMFSGCSSLTSLDVSSMDFGNVTSFYEMFRDCSSLEELTIGNNFVGEAAVDLCNLFYGCEKLRTVNLSKFNTKNVRDFSFMFHGCRELRSTGLGLDHLVTTCASEMQYMFDGCESLTEIDVSHFDMSGVKEMEGMFYGCKSVTSLDLYNMDTRNVENMMGLFHGCSALQSVTFGGLFNTSKVRYMNYMFSGCKSLAELDVSCFDTGSVEYMQDMFYNCAGLDELILTNFNTAKVQQFNEMFDCCRNLESVLIPNFTTASASTVNAMFANCDSLVSIDVSGFETSRLTDVGTRNFTSNCPRLASVKVGEGWTSNILLQLNEGRSTGFWYSTDTGRKYLPENIPAGIADTYTAQFVNCEVTFDRMGLGDYKPAAACYEPGSLIRRPKDLKEKGYAFEGWYTKNFERKWDFDTDVMPANDLTLYANWVPAAYTLKFYPGVSTATGTMEDQTLHYGTAANIKKCAFVNVGYTFLEWNRRKDGTGTSYLDEESVKNLTEKDGNEIELYAIWEGNKYTITFLKNSVTAEGSMEDMKCVFGQKYMLNPMAFTNYGYTFTGWSLKADGTGLEYSDRQTVINLSTRSDAVVPMYAKWEPTKYHISYEVGEGIPSVNNPLIYTMLSADIKAEDLIAPVRTDWVFSGWFNDPGFAEPFIKIPSGSTGDVTIYAKWTEKPQEEPEVQGQENGQKNTDIPSKEENMEQPGEKAPQQTEEQTPEQTEKAAGTDAPANKDTEEKAKENVQPKKEKQSGGSGSSGFSAGGSSGGSSGGPTGGSTGGSSGGPSGGSSGGSSGSKGAAGTPKLAQAPLKLAAPPADLPQYVETSGSWFAVQDSTDASVTDWSYIRNDGTKVSDSWECIYNPFADTASGQRSYDWFRFDPAGFMMTGWFTDKDGHQYYLNPASDGSRGKMVTGWFKIGDKWYLFNDTEGSGTMGALIRVSDKPE